MPTGANNTRYVVVQDAGETGWHQGTANAENVGMEDILDALADDVLIRGDGTPGSNSRTAYAGRIYLDVGTSAGVEGEVYRADGTSWIKVGRITQYSEIGQISFPTAMTQYASGLSDVEIARYPTAANEVLTVWRLAVSLKGGVADPDFSVALVDESDGSQIVSATSLEQGTATPLGTSTAGADITLRITNQTGSVQNVSITGRAVLEST